jgi:hypothetical protein
MKSGYMIKFCLPIFIAGFFLSCSKNIYENGWQSTKMKDARSLKESENPLRYYDNTNRLQYDVTNDSMNLYVSIRATDQQNQIKIIRSGLQLWIDTIGKNKKETGLFFPLSSLSADSAGKIESPQDRIRPTQSQKPGANSLKNRYNNEPKQMKLIGFKPPIGGLTPLQNEYGISADIDWDKRGSLNYHAIIPFKTFCNNAFSASGKQKTFSVSIIIPANSTQTTSGRGGGYGTPRGGMGGGMGRGRSGGGMGGGGSFGGGGRRNGSSPGNYGGGGTGSQGTLNEYTKITMKIRLAVEPK